MPALSNRDETNSSPGCERESTAMEEQLKNVRARAAAGDGVGRYKGARQQAERGRGQAQRASADDWWDISSKRVSEYIERVERSVERLDNDKK